MTVLVYVLSWISIKRKNDEDKETLINGQKATVESYKSEISHLREYLLR